MHRRVRLDIRTGRSPYGSQWAVRTEVRGPTTDDLPWRVARLAVAEVRAALQ